MKTWTEFNDTTAAIIEGDTSSKETENGDRLVQQPNLLLLTDYSFCSQVLMHVISAKKKQHTIYSINSPAQNL